MKTLFKLVTIILFLGYLCSSCKKEEVPSVTTVGVTDIDGVSAVSGGNITNEGSGIVLTRGVCWSTTTTPTINNSKTSDGAGVSSFISNLSGLSGATTYYIRAYATNEAGTGYGMTLSFRTLGQLPYAITQQAIITGKSATLNGTISPNYLSTKVEFEYGTSINYGLSVVAAQSPLSGNLIVNVSADIQGLMEGTTYHYRIKAENSYGSVYGSDLAFSIPIIPSLSTKEVTLVTHNSASSGGDISSDGGTLISNRGLCWSKSPNPTINNSKTIDGFGIGIFTSSMKNLMPNTTYYVRAYATNSIGTAYGNETSFTTKTFYVVPTLLEIEVREYFEEYTVSNAKVVLYNSVSDWDARTNAVAEGITDINGICVFPDLESQIYYVEVWENGHNNYTLRTENVDFIRTPVISNNRINRFLAFVDKTSPTKSTVNTIRNPTDKKQPEPLIWTPQLLEKYGY